MSAPKHTPEPWVAGWGGGITGPNAATMLQWDYKFPIHRVSDLHVAIREPVLALPTTDPAHEANAARIVACVNACAGMDDPAAEIAGLSLDAAIGRLVRLKLTSSNQIPVERCTVKASEIAALAKLDGKS